MSFTDKRGTIRDVLVEPIDAVTYIDTVDRAVRGNHVHKETTQWTYVIRGCLRVVTPDGERYVSTGQLWMDPPGQPHAWEAYGDTQVMVFTRGPRSGESYETDTTRLAEPLIP